MSSDTSSTKVFQEVNSSMTDVMVMEDRAQITRKSTFEINHGTQKIKVGPISPLVADESLRVKATQGQVQINECKVERTYLIKGDRTEIEKDLNEKIRDLAKSYYMDHAVLESLAHKRKILTNSAKQFSHFISEVVSVKGFNEEWKSESSLLWDEMEKTEEDYLETQWKQEERLWQFRRLEDQIDETQQPDSQYVSYFIVVMDVESSGQVTLEYNYQVPCAIWRPMYSAELTPSNGKSKIEWNSMGCVWQKTGEDWEEVNLSFSTARPTLGANMPLLQDDYLSTREKSKEEKKTIHVESRDEEIQVHDSQSTSLVESDTPPGIDDGGEVRTFHVNDPVTIKSDGKPYQFLFDNWTETAETKMTCYPEKARYVFMKSQQVNPSNRPLLAGPVALIKYGTYVGRSSIKYIAPQEQFDLSWGSEDGITVVRSGHHHRDEAGLTKKQEFAFHRFIFLTNQTNQAHRIQIKERIPVSEIKHVEVDVKKDGTTPGFEVDKYGIITWDIELNEAEEKEINLDFKVNMPQKVKWNP